MSNKLFAYLEIPTMEYGLKFKPTLSHMSKDFDLIDWFDKTRINGIDVDLGYKMANIRKDFSDKNKQALLEIMETLKHQNRLNSIIEIGAFRSGEDSSTKIIHNNKLSNTKYLGIDLVESNLAKIRDHSNNIFCLACDSSATEVIMKYARETCGIEKFDIVFIDGWHSIDQVIDDWKFSKFLAPGGVILMHDSNFHPGPRCVFDAIDEKIFEKEQLCTDVFDFGLAKARLL